MEKLEENKQEKNEYKEDFHRKMMKFALETAELGFDSLEVPVGCVFVDIISSSEYKIVAKAHNLTNESNNATLHCEIICINKLNQELSKNSQKSPFQNLTLYVTCEPCIMCAYALNLVGIKEVYFGCKNDKFGGNGSVFSFNEWLPNPYKSFGGIFEKEAAEVLRKFYERGNTNIPEEKRNRKRQKK